MCVVAVVAQVLAVVRVVIAVPVVVAVRAVCAQSALRQLITQVKFAAGRAILGLEWP